MDDLENNTNNLSWFKSLTHNFLRAQSPKDLIRIINSAAKRDIIDNESKDMLSGVLNISTMHVRDIMVPRSQMVTVSINMTSKEIISIIATSSHTRVPVLNEEKDDIIGILHAKDMLKLLYTSQEQDPLMIHNTLKPAVFVPESKRLDSLLKEFKSGHKHIAIVVDEYGTIAGMITIEDILEEIVGNIEDEFDQEESYIQKISPQEFHVEAITEINEFNSYFNSSLSNESSDTIGGLILQSLEHLPEEGEIIILGNFVFTVLKSSKRKIETLSVVLNEDKSI